jgi:hypothetical protein
MNFQIEIGARVFGLASLLLAVVPHPNPSSEGRGALLPSPSGRRAGDEGLLATVGTSHPTRRNP